jgi:SSS family solute:Na+ symporter
MAILFALNVIIMLLIGKFYPRDSEYNQKYTEQVDIQPWKYGVGVGIVICVIVISSFLYFS